MGLCISNIKITLEFIETKNLKPKLLLSKSFMHKIIEVLRQRVLKVDNLSQRFKAFTETQGLHIIKQDYLKVFDRSSKEDPLAFFYLGSEKGLLNFLAAEGTLTEDTYTVDYFDSICPRSLPEVMFIIQFKRVDHLTINNERQRRKLGPDFIIPKVIAENARKVELQTIPIEPPDIINIRSVEELIFSPYNNPDLKYIRQFTNLKSLTVNIRSQVTDSQITLNLPNLEVLIMKFSKVMVVTKDLRKLQVIEVDVDQKFAEFIGNQKRLLSLELSKTTNFHLIEIPATVVKLILLPKLELTGSASSEANKKPQAKLSKHLASFVGKLKLRLFETNIWLETIEALDTSKLKDFSFNGFSKKNEKKSWLFTIKIDFDVRLLTLSNSSKSCLIQSPKFAALNFVSDKTTSLTIEKELKGKKDKLPVLKKVEKLKLLYKVSDDQALVLSKVFPQFTKSKIKAKGTSK